MSIREKVAVMKEDAEERGRLFAEFGWSASDSTLKAVAEALGVVLSIIDAEEAEPEWVDWPTGPGLWVMHRDGRSEQVTASRALDTGDIAIGYRGVRGRLKKESRIARGALFCVRKPLPVPPTSQSQSS